MDRPFLTDLQYLFTKLAESPTINSTDAALLDKAYSLEPSSDMANCINQIFILISQSSIAQFWQSFSTILSSSQNDEIRILMFSILSKRIVKEWHLYESSIQQGLKVYIIQNINKCIEEGNNNRILNAMNQILVCIFRCEISSLFKDFVSNLESQGADLPFNKLNNNLYILRRLLEEGVNSTQGLRSPSESYQFKRSLDHDMRTILRVLCLYLQSKGVNRNAVVNKCLLTLRCSIEYIPAFEIFNCNLIEILAGLIGQAQYHHSLITCLQQIFRFKQCGVQNNNHSKIVKKLLLILQTYLLRFQNIKTFSHNEIDNASTEESYKSSKTKAKRQSNPQKYSDLLNLVYQFLIRYVPFMDKARGEQDLDIEYQGNIKIYFSQDLYESFGLIYWRLLQFLQIILQGLDPFQVENEDEEATQEKRKAICCIRLMISMLIKLKINAREQIRTAIQTTIQNFTPLAPQFVPYYLQFDLLQKGLQIATQPPFFSFDIEEEYKEFMKAILSQNSIAQIYFRIVQQKIENIEMYEISEKDRRVANLQSMQSKQLQRYATLKTINSINRVCWSIVYAYHCNQQALKKLPIAKLVITLTKSTQLQKSLQLQRCFSLNSKYVAQVYYPNSTLYVPLFSTLQITKNESVMEFTLLLLSKIFLSDSINCNLQSEQMKVIVQKLHEIEALDPSGDNLIQIYPAFVNLLIRKMEQASDIQKSNSRLKEVLQALVKPEIESLAQFSRTSDTRDHIDLQRSILLFKKIKQISQQLAYIFKNNKKIKNSTSVVNWMRIAVRNIVTDFEYKNRMFSDYLKGIQKEHFDILHILNFRKYYVEVIRSMIVIFVSLNNNQAKEFKPNFRHKKQYADLIKLAEQELKTDFLSQQQFKVKEFLQFEVDFYEWYIENQPQASEGVINTSFTQILQNLSGWAWDQEIVIQKYKFVKDVVRIFGLRLNKRNIELLMQLFGQIQQNNTQVASIELILDIFHHLFTITMEDAIKRSKKIVLEQFVSLVILFFERLFSFIFQKEPIFSKLGELLYSLIQMTGYHESITTFDLQKILQNHIIAGTNIQFDEENSTKYSLIFKEKNLSRWITALKEYVVYLTGKANGRTN